MKLFFVSAVLSALPTVAAVEGKLDDNTTRNKRLRQVPRGLQTADEGEKGPFYNANPEFPFGHIVGGSFAEAGEFPNFASLFNPLIFSTFYCGGTLIAENKVLTAAHCVDFGSGDVCPSLVVIGATTVDYEAGTTDGEVFEVTGCVSHPDYSSSDGDGNPSNDPLRADVAVITLAGSSSVTPVTLNEDTNWPDASNDEQDCEVIGFGDTSEGSGAGSTRLKKLDTFFQDMDQCIAVGIFDVNNEEHVCADVANEGDCQGDSGGPLFTSRCGCTLQIGVVSFGFGCARNEARDYYAKVATYYDWINDQAGGGLRKAPAAGVLGWAESTLARAGQWLTSSRSDP